MKKKQWFWRPIVQKIISYSEAIEMSKEQLLEANAAIDLKDEATKSSMES
ncbi:hypothetical protein [Halobacillus litoralis]|nr:hypothetical protein [Halobacillus litoralis]